MATRHFEDHDMVMDEDEDHDGLSSSLMAQPHPELSSRKPPSDEDFFPQTVTWEEEIEGRITEFAVTVMHKKLLVVITQCGKIGSWIQATVDEEPCITDPAFIPDTTYETTVIHKSIHVFSSSSSCFCDQNLFHRQKKYDMSCIGLF